MNTTYFNFNICRIKKIINTQYHFFYKMIPFKKAIRLWEQPLGEEMIDYAILVKKAKITPEKIFVIMYWDPTKKKWFTRGLMWDS